MASQFGMMNALRSGNVIFDMCIAMCIPFLLQSLKMMYDALYPKFMAYLASPTKDSYFRDVVYQSRGQYDPTSKDDRNNILQKGLAMYIGQMVKVEYLNASVNLSAIKEKGQRDDSWCMVYGGTAEQLKAYKINSSPPFGTWISLRDKLQYRRIRDDEEEGGEKNKSAAPKVTITFQFMCKGAGGDKVIDAFIEEAFQWYVKQMEQTEDHSRYMYNLVSGMDGIGGANNEEGGGEGAQSSHKYKRYKLSDYKDFGSLFFPEKDMLLKMLHNFETKSGKYSVPGYPHKLGLLLHGPPGTGKTSLIKALACHTKRNIISIPLARIKTNQELMDVVFDQVYVVPGEEMPVKLPFANTIFVIEDIDAASPIVLSRTRNEKKGPKTKVTVTREEMTSAPVHAALDENGVDTGLAAMPPLTREPSMKRDSLSITGEEGAGLPVLTKLTRETTVQEEETTELDSDDEEGLLAGPLLPGDDGDMLAALAKSLADGGGSKDKDKTKYASKRDKLDLAGLLNVLDGVVDCPARIVVMTSNHPEKLDAALIRPGRIDKKIFLGYMQQRETLQMTAHYFQSALTGKQEKQMADVFGGRQSRVTPAMVEQLCAEHEEIDDFIVALKTLVDATSPRNHA